MPGPWEKYQQAAPAYVPQDGPWAKYGGQNMPTMTVTAPRETTFDRINDFGNDLGDAFAHHLGNLPLGAAQLLAHTLVKDRVDTMGSMADAVDPSQRSLSSLITGKLDEQPGLLGSLRSLRQKGVAAVDGAVGKLDQYIANREQKYQQDTPDSVGSYAGATLGEVLPWATGMGEARALGLVPKATSTLGKLGVLAGEGAAMAAPQPVTSGDYAKGKLSQEIIGALTGPVTYGLAKGVEAVGKGVSEATKYVRDPQSIADRYIKSLFGGDEATATLLKNAPQYVNGDVPTAAQAIAQASPSDEKSIAAVAAERLLRNNPNTRQAFAAADAQSNRARQAVVSRLAGTDADLASAKQARRDAIAPYVDEFLTDSRPIVRWTGARNALKNVLDKPGRMPASDFDALQQAQGIVSKVRGGSMQEDDALQALNELGDSVVTKTAQDAFANAHKAINRNMVDPSGVLRAIATIRNGPLGVDAERASRLDALLSSIDRAKNINGLVGTDMLDAVRQQAGKILGTASDQSKLAYGPARDEIAKAIERVAPGYINHLGNYAKTSGPINTMESVRALADPNAPGSLNAVGDPQLTASRLKLALRGDDKARYPMADDARAELEKVRQSLARRSISDDKMAASGPASAADIQAQTALSRGLFGDVLSEKPALLARALSGTLGAAAGSVVGHPILGAGVGGLIPEAIQGVKGRIASRIGQTAASAPNTAEAILRALQQEKAASQPSSLDRLLFGHQGALQADGAAILNALTQQPPRRMVEAR